MTTKNPLTEVREHLIADLLVGPFLPPTEGGEEADEELPATSVVVPTP